MKLVTGKDGRWYVEDGGSVVMGPFSERSAAEKAMRLKEALVVQAPPDQGTRYGSDDPARRGPPGDAFRDMDRIQLSPEAMSRLREAMSPEMDMSLEPVMERLEEIGGPRKASGGEPGTSGQGRFGIGEEEKRRIEDRENVRKLERIRAVSLRDALLRPQ